MAWYVYAANIIGVIFIIIGIILDFVAADKSKTKDNSSARSLALAGGILTIIGLIILLIGIILQSIACRVVNKIIKSGVELLDLSS